MINAAVLNATPTIERMEMMLIKFFFRLEKRYRLAMKKGRFKKYWFIKRYLLFKHFLSGIHYSFLSAGGMCRFLINSSMRCAFSSTSSI